MELSKKITKHNRTKYERLVLKELTVFDCFWWIDKLEKFLMENLLKSLRISVAVELGAVGVKESPLLR